MLRILTTNHSIRKAFRFSAYAKTPRTLIANFNRAHCAIWRVGPALKDTTKETISVELDYDPYMRGGSGVINQEVWDYEAYAEGLIAMIGTCYRNNVDMNCNEFEEAIIDAHKRIVDKARR